MDCERAAGAVAESDRNGGTGVGGSSAGSTLGSNNDNYCDNPPDAQTTPRPRWGPVLTRRGGGAGPALVRVRGGRGGLGGLGGLLALQVIGFLALLSFVLGGGLGGGLGGTLPAPLPRLLLPL